MRLPLIRRAPTTAATALRLVRCKTSSPGAHPATSVSSTAPAATGTQATWVRAVSTSARADRAAAAAAEAREEQPLLKDGKLTRHHPRLARGRGIEFTKDEKRIESGDQAPVRFDDMNMDVRLKKALKQDFRYAEASLVQSMCFDSCLNGDDVVLKAKTGTGKTLGFLLPTIQKHFRDARKMARQKPRRVPVLVIAPTRELAKQAETEADRLLRYLPRELRAQSCIGGTPRGVSMKRLERVPPMVLAATPGRLLDMIRTCGWENVFDDLRVLVLDEADRLLDMGFRKEIEQILQHLNARQSKRQTLLFSATFPPDVEQMAKLACLQPPKMLEVPDAGKDQETETASSVTQRAVEVQMDSLLPSLHSMIHAHIAERKLQRMPSKVMVFFPTAVQTQFFSTLFERDSFKLYTLHSRMQQSKRDRISGTFRTAKDGVLFTTDVSARGIDYPGVSLVVQVGLPSSREQYVHRVGRTGRGGSKGVAVMLTTPQEGTFVKSELKGLPIEQQSMHDIVSANGLVDASNTAAVDAMIDESRAFIAKRYDQLRKYDPERGSDTYLSFLGHYRGMLSTMKMSPQQLVDFGNAYATDALMLPTPPVLSQSILARMGLDNKSLSRVRVSSDRRRPHAHSRMPRRQHQRPSRARKPRPPPRY
ncbi:DEAD-box ATP-dependent RNA helicase 26 [Salpingoeca rosetta]|uniref:ATP-dependent RNA helicase n=1 Tax=Salpingoeca rosetta (strain ATCC 50818 / BSB-021) TaxID=946362 RepID=F2UTM1_SALR5|nr:DEAD-box ATP-dependent RNA helicase 26 [Salpingoeca rosetta]EGD73370.1 DEAD-box ATP-dependent RNA helicase 26 [Salpingoeca rosetta]|eukprot:XP_004987484.1 DEAD-box ATP-dependent RNA helicase 26 [Salpingoeca rosetta]